MATSLLAQPKAFSSGRLNTLQAYTEPMEIWIPTADAAISHRFFIAASMAGAGLSQPGMGVQQYSERRELSGLTNQKMAVVLVNTALTSFIIIC